MISFLRGGSMRRALLALSLAVLVTPSARAAAPHPFLDLDFEAPECTAGWVDEPFRNAFEAVLDPMVVHSGRQSLRIRTGPQEYGAYDHDLPLTGFQGQTVRLSGFIQTDGVTGSRGSGGPPSTRT